MSDFIVYLPAELADLLDVSTTTPADRQVLVFDTATGLWGPGDGFDPDSPLDYFTMIDQGNGDVVEVTISSGAWVLTSVSPLTTEAGDRITTEAGDVLVME